MKIFAALMLCLLCAGGCGNLHAQVSRTENFRELNSARVNQVRFAAAYYYFPKFPRATLTGSTVPALTHAVTATVYYTANQGGCPLGIDGVAGGAVERISGGTGAAENVTLIAGGSCIPGDSSGGSVKFVPANDHSGNWTLESATGGIQEAFNDGPTPANGVSIEVHANQIGTVAYYADITQPRDSTLFIDVGTQLVPHGSARILQDQGAVLNCGNIQRKAILADPSYNGATLVRNLHQDGTTQSSQTRGCQIDGNRQGGAVVSTAVIDYEANGQPTGVYDSAIVNSSSKGIKYARGSYTGALQQLIISNTEVNNSLDDNVYVEDVIGFVWDNSASQGVPTNGKALIHLVGTGTSGSGAVAIFKGINHLEWIPANAIGDVAIATDCSVCTYAANDVVNVSGGGGIRGKVVIKTVSGGHPTAVSVSEADAALGTARGIDYVTSSGIATSGGGGAGLTLNIVANTSSGDHCDSAHGDVDGVLIDGVGGVNIEGTLFFGGGRSCLVDAAPIRITNSALNQHQEFTIMYDNAGFNPMVVDELNATVVGDEGWDFYSNAAWSAFSRVGSTNFYRYQTPDTIGSGPQTLNLIGAGNVFGSITHTDTAGAASLRFFEDTAEQVEINVWGTTNAVGSSRQGNLEIVNVQSNDVSFWTSSTQRFTIKNDGKVGIGTSTPGYELEIVGDINATGIIHGALASPLIVSDAGSIEARIIHTDTAGASHLTFYEGGGETMELNQWGSTNAVGSSRQGNIELININDNDVSIWTNSAQRLTIKADGKVGIGTSSPGAALDVAGNIGASGSVTASSFSGSGASLTTLNGSQVASGAVGVSVGGTGGTTASGARSNLGASAAGHGHAFSCTYSGTADLGSGAYSGTCSGFTGPD